jgi:hypothetical protein
VPFCIAFASMGLALHRSDVACKVI